MPRRAGRAAGTPPARRTRRRCRSAPAVRASRRPRRSRRRTPRRGRSAATSARSRRTRSWSRPSASTWRLIRMWSPTARLGWPGPAAELQHRVGALVGAGVDGDQDLHAMGTAVRGLLWIGGQHRARRWASARCGLAGQHMPGFGGDRAACCVLERQRDVDLLLAGPQPHRAGQHGNADDDQCSDDDLGGHRTQRRGAAGVRVGVRVRHPQQGRGPFWPATGGRTTGSCPAARSRWPGRGPMAASRCAGDPASAS